MAAKKKASAKKSAAPKKKAARKAISKSAPEKQEILETRSLESEDTYTREEEIQPSMPPVYTTSSTKSFKEDKEESAGSNSMLKYIIAASLILVGVIVVSVMTKKDPYTPEKTSSPVATESVKATKKEAEPSEKVQAPPAAQAKETTGESTSPSVSAGEPSALPGYAVAQMVEGKTHPEASSHCKSLEMRLPKVDELRSLKNIPKELRNATIWAADVIGGRYLRFEFARGKALYTDPKTKLTVLCRESR